LACFYSFYIPVPLDEAILDEAVISPVMTTRGSRFDVSKVQTIDKNDAASKKSSHLSVLEENDIATFKLKHNLKKDTNLHLLKIEKDNTVTLRDGRVFGLSNLKAVDVYSSDAQYILDGEPIALPSVGESRTLIGKSVEGDTIMITKGMSDDIRTLDIFGLDGSDEYMATIQPGMLAIIKPDDLDFESLKKFTMGDMAFLDADEEDDAEPYNRALARLSMPEGRYLRATRRQQEVVSPGGGDPVSSVGARSLQSTGCSSLFVIEVAIAFDSTFCAKQGGEEAARQELERIVARASMMYQQQGVCTKLVISHIEGFCSSSEDPYRAGVDLNDIGCNSNGLLPAFEQYWQANRGSVRRDAAHLFYARDLAGAAVGCASLGTLCSTSNGFGVNEMEFSTDEQRRAIVFAHELGHNIGTCDIQNEKGSGLICVSKCGAIRFRRGSLWFSHYKQKESNSLFAFVVSSRSFVSCFGFFAVYIGLNHVPSADGNRYIMDSVGSGTHIWDPTSLNHLAQLLPSYSCVSQEQDSPPPPPQEGGFFMFRSQSDSNLCFDLRYSDTTNGSLLWLYPCSDSPAQQWMLDSQGKLRSAIDTNKCVVGNAGSVSAGTFLMLWDCLEDDSRYYFDGWSDGSIRPRNDENICVDASSNPPLDGQPTLIFWYCHGESNQLWNW
jgi:hypothetical protein